MLRDYVSLVNDFTYKKGQKLYVNDLANFKNSYAVYRNHTLDWIPKEFIKIIR